MALPQEDTKKVYIGDGIQTIFPFTCSIENESDIKVYININNQAEDTPVDPADFDIEYFPETQNGNITYPNDDGDPLTINDKIAVDRETANTQPFDTSNQEKVKGEFVEDSDDNIVRQVTELNDIVKERCLILQPTSTTTPQEAAVELLEARDEAVESAANAAVSETNSAQSASESAVSKDLSEDWAIKEDGLVNGEDYSSKAYAVGGDGTETNNSKYWAEQAEDAAASVKPLVIEYMNIAIPSSSLVENTRYIISTASGEINQTLPIVTTGDKKSFYFTLTTNSNHFNLSVDGGSQQIKGLSALSLSTENATIAVQQNGVDGYELVTDTRVYDRVITVTENLSLTSGYESGGHYVGALEDEETVIITIRNAELEHIGDLAKFSKLEGENAVYRIVSQDTTFDQTIFNNDEGFTIEVVEDALGVARYTLVQDSRAKAQENTIVFFPTDTVSSLDPAYGVLETIEQPEEIITSITVSSTNPANPTSLGFFINDNKALIGLISARNIDGLGTLKKNISGNKNIKFRFKYYEYNYDTLTLNPTELVTTNYSAAVTSDTSYEQRLVSGILPENSWATESGTKNTLVIELQAYIEGVGGANPALMFKSGGENASRTTIAVPLTSVNHATLGGVVKAQTGVPDGHVDNSYPLQLPELTTIERDNLGVINAGHIINNITTNTMQKYNGSIWEDLAASALPTDYIALDTGVGSAQIFISDIPSLTANVDQGYIASASSEIASPANSAFVAFDGITTGINGWASNNTVAGWLQIQIPIAKTYKSYKIHTYDNNINSNVKDWTLKGSNTGAFAGEEDVLDTQSNITGWVATESRGFGFSNITSYLYYRLDITDNNGNAFTAIGELEFSENSLNNIDITKFIARTPDDTVDLETDADTLCMSDSNDWADGIGLPSTSDNSVATTGYDTPTGEKVWVNNIQGVLFGWQLFDKNDATHWETNYEVSPSTPGIDTRFNNTGYCINYVDIKSRDSADFDFYPIDYEIVYTTETILEPEGISATLDDDYTWIPVKTITGDVFTQGQLKTLVLDNPIPPNATWGIRCTNSFLAFGGTALLTLARLDGYSNSLSNATIHTWADYNNGTSRVIFADINGTGLTDVNKAIITTKFDTDGSGAVDESTIVNTSVKRAVVERWLDGDTGYIKYNDGFIEQWGRSPAGSSVTVTFPIPFSNTDYAPNCINLSNYSEQYINTLTTTSMKINSSESRSAYWQAKGY